MTTDIPIILRASPQDFIEISRIKKFDDGSGYSSWLRVGSGRFSCSGLQFYFDDLKGFIQDLTKAFNQVGGKARLGQIYEEDYIEVEVLPRGQVEVTGFIQDFASHRQELRFSFHCDQTFLPEVLRSLNRVGKELEV